MTEKSSDTENPLYLRSRYPKLAKPESDGTFCYHVQRRLSCHISQLCVVLKISPTLATLIDLLFGLSAAISISLQHYFLGAFFIHLFGIWSCVDGEIARLSGQTSKMGDFYDTMVDRMTELVVLVSLVASLLGEVGANLLNLIFIFYLGGIFLLTVSSEKYRSSFQDNYPKQQVESFFCWISAGSDIRLLYFTIALVVHQLTSAIQIFIWLLGFVSLFMYLNYFFRMWKIRHLIQS